MIKAVLFDLDGTLVNSLEDLADSANFALTQFGFPTHEMEEYKYFIGNGIPNLVERIIPEQDEETKMKALECFKAYYREHYTDKTVVYDGIYDTVDAIRHMGLKIAVVSNKVHEMTVTIVEKLLGDRFDIVCGKQDSFPTKPDPTLTLKVMDDLGVKPCECLFVGDSGTDAKTSVNAGCAGVGVLWGFRKEDELLENGAKYIVKKPCEIVDIIQRLNNEG